MKLIRCNKSFTYSVKRLMTEYELLRDFSIKNIEFKIKLMQEQINEFYHLSMSHTTSSDVYGYVTVGCSVDELAIWIIEQKERLDRYISKSNQNIELLEFCLKHYTHKEQQKIKLYLSTNGRYKNDEIIERLRTDLYTITNHKRNERYIKRKEMNKAIIINHVQMLKEKLNKDKEVLAV